MLVIAFMLSLVCGFVVVCACVVVDVYNHCFCVLGVLQVFCVSVDCLRLVLQSFAIRFACVSCLCMP